MRVDFDWQYRSGRDSEGDQFRQWVLVHSSGRILGKISCPLPPDEYQYFAYLYVKDASPESDDHLRFIDLEGAKRYIECCLESFESDAKPQKEPCTPATLDSVETVPAA